MPRRSLVLVLLLAAAALASPARGELFRLEARYWLAEASGDGAVAVGLVPGLPDFRTGLDLDVDEAPELRLALSPVGSLELRLAYLQTDLGGQGRISGSLPLILAPIEVEARLTAALELEYARVGLAWPLIKLPGGVLRFGPLVEVKAFRGEISAGLPDEPEPLFVADEFDVAAAAAGAVLEIRPLERLQIFSEISIALDTGSVDLTDFEAGVRFRPSELLSVMGGYRILELEVTEGLIVFDAELEGLFVGAGLQF